MSHRFLKPRLSSNQKRRLKALYRRDDYHGFISMGINIGWIAAAVTLTVFGGYWFYALSILIVGARQRAIASLLHEDVLNDREFKRYVFGHGLAQAAEC